MPRIAEMIGYEPPSGSAAEVKKDAWDEMSEEEQEFLRVVASDVRQILTEQGEKPAAAWIKAQRLDSEETLALYWLLPANVRSALKRGEKCE